MKAENIIKEAKMLCKIDIDETEFDDILMMFLNTTLTDLAIDSNTPAEIRVPVINGQATIEEGYRILDIDPVLNINDRVVGNTIITTHKGVLKVRVIQEAVEVKLKTEEVELANHLAQIVKYNIASLWYGLKRKTDLASFWNQYYFNEKSKRLLPSEAEETYELPLLFTDLY